MHGALLPYNKNIIVFCVFLFYNNRKCSMEGFIMETKDWVTLFVPIVCNGVLLFLIQQFFSRKIKKIEWNWEYKQKVIEEYLSLLRDFYTKVRKIADVDEKRSGVKIEFASVWNPASGSFHKLNEFVSTHTESLKEVNLDFDLCRNIWDEMCADLLMCRETNNNIVTPDVLEKLSKNYVKIQSVILEIITQCERKLLQM